MRILTICCLLYFTFSCQNNSKVKDKPAVSTERNTATDHFFTSFDGTRIFYKDQGTGTPVLLLHGFISNGSSWYDTALAKTLNQKGYRVLIPDLRGNGKSDQPTNPEAYRDNAEVKDLQALLTHLDIDTIQAVGYSRGSIVLAQWLTVDARITKAVLGGMGIDFTNPNWDRRVAFADAFSGRKPLTDLTEGAVAYATSIDANLPILGLLQDYQPVTSVAALGSISIPTLVIAGDQDLDNGDPKELHGALGNATIEIVPGDHNTTYRKEAFAKTVVTFLD